MAKTRNKNCGKGSTRKRIRPEAELEALLSSALAAAFPTIPREQFHHQTRFKVRLGHEEVEYDAAWAWEAEGRADIIIFCDARALAVVELKRESRELSDEDRKQAQSYANQMTPRPPLVILTNGRRTEIFDSSTAQTWSPGDNAEVALAKLLGNAAKVAAAGMRWAVEVLMGPEAGLWVKVVRARTAHLIAQMTAEPGATGKPFSQEFRYPRLITREAESLLKSDASIVLVEGTPLIGKSNVLREIAERLADSKDYAILMLRGSRGAGLFQRIANLFSAELEWEVTADNIRQWLRRMANFGYGPILVLAIDGLEADGPIATDLAGCGKTLPSEASA